ncbi:MAG: DUF2911 domain-containing protein, partial [Rhodothermales bacterium]|nr:DUF2911 domain-containing protein [Rhodothermales bacterium]
MAAGQAHPGHLLAQAPTCQFRGTPDALAERASPLDSVAVPLGGEEAKLCYGRPTVRGRAMIGGQLPYGTPWEMGANEPTTLHLPFAARVGTLDLDPGSYSLYAIPGEGDWTIVVNGNPDRWGVPISAAVRSADVGSFAVTPQVRAQQVETLTFSFRPSGARAGARG